MRDPTEWFNKAIETGNYDKEVIEHLKKCITKDAFDIDSFLKWVSKKIDNDDRL